MGKFPAGFPRNAMSDIDLDEILPPDTDIDAAIAAVNAEYGRRTCHQDARGRFQKGNRAARGRRQPASVTAGDLGSAVSAKRLRAIVRRLARVALRSENGATAVAAAGVLMRLASSPNPGADE